MGLADLLSRSPGEEEASENENLDEEFVHMICKYLPISIEIQNQIKSYINADKTMMLIKKYCSEGWPRDVKELPVGEIRHFWKNKSDIFVEGDILFMGEKVLIPEGLRKSIVTQLHESHMGIDKTKLKAKETLYWPNMLQEIQDFIVACKICQKLSNNQQREPLKPHDIPNIPFYKIGMDFCTHNGQEYLIIMDYLSKWLEVIKVNSKNITTLIKVLWDVFSTHGIPGEIVSDNNPFNSYAFRNFAKTNNITLTFSSPRYARSNGQAERGVQIAKRMLDKSHMTGINLKKLLFEYRNAPITGVGYSPAQMLMGRRLRSSLPCTNDTLIPKIVLEEVKEKIIQKSKVMEHYYNKGTRLIKELQKGDKIWVKRYWESGWEEGVVVDKDESPRSYWVKLNSNGRVIRRNRCFIKLSRGNENVRLDTGKGRMNKVNDLYEEIETDSESVDFKGFEEKDCNYDKYWKFKESLL